jgi:hypothetical protein
MADFCAHALALITGRQVADFRNRRTADLARELIPLLLTGRFLLILDGLERVLAAYNRYDAAQVRDEDLKLPDAPLQPKAQDCIRAADSSLLQAFTRVTSTKILASSRLIPSALLDSGGRPRSGVAHLLLNGLEDEDAESMLLRIGVKGDSGSIREYLTTNFCCHPLIVGVIGGLINNFRSAPGDFDRWLQQRAPEGLLASEMDLVRCRHRILWAAFEDISEESRTLLARIALVSEGVDYETLVELNPRRPDRPREVYPPGEWLLELPDYIDLYNQDKLVYEAYLADLARWRSSLDFAKAEAFLRETIRDLSSRGLLQADPTTNKFDLHPVVRGYAVSSIEDEKREGIATRVFDHFSSRQDVSLQQAQSLNDIRNGLQVVRTLLDLSRLEQAAKAANAMTEALFWSLEAYDVYLSFVRPIFRKGWRQEPEGIDAGVVSALWTNTGLALSVFKHHKEASVLHELALAKNISLDYSSGVLTSLTNLAVTADEEMRLCDVESLDQWGEAAALVLGRNQDIAVHYLQRSQHRCRIGDFEAAERYWSQFDALPRPSNRSIYRPGYGEYCLARIHLFRGTLDTELHTRIDRLAKDANSRFVIRAMCWLRGEWNLERGDWERAGEYFEEELRMLREVNMDSSHAEVRLALTQLITKGSDGIEEIANRIAALDDPPYASLAELYLALGDCENARKQAHVGYVEAWGVGMPWICWRTLRQCRAIFKALGDAEPQLPPFDPGKLRAYAFEAPLRAYLQTKVEENLVRGTGSDRHVM